MSMVEQSVDNEVRSTGSISMPLPSTSGLSKPVYAIVRNIPATYHVRHLRYFFSEFVENSIFECFHYRHRPEVQITSSDKVEEASTSESTCKFCCVVSFRITKQRNLFIRKYNRVFWLSPVTRDEIPLKCFVFPVKVDQSISPDSEVISVSDLRSMIELNPPSLMPRGNVGTSSEYFLDQIRLCKFPSSMISKLGLKIRKRPRKYGAVYLKYGKRPKISRFVKSVAEFSDDKNRLPKSHKSLKYDERAECYEAAAAGEADVISDEDDNELEDWERYEALHDDVTEQERTKPRKYEEEQEVTWEKGGPGLVWYTDNFYWREIEEGTDCDWKWADDWDVDFSGYYDKNGGDHDAKQAIEMMENQNLRLGKISKSAFGEKRQDAKRVRRRSIDEAISDVSFGEFEQHTKGVGSRILKKYGWKPGSGLGVANSGCPYTVSVELEEVGGAKLNGERSGFGYHGEQLQRTGFSKRTKHVIATKYDQKDDRNSDMKDKTSVLRRQEGDIYRWCA